MREGGREGGSEGGEEGRREGTERKKERKGKSQGEPERGGLNVCVCVFNVCCNCKRERPRSETKGDQFVRCGSMCVCACRRERDLARKPKEINLLEGFFEFATPSRLVDVGERCVCMGVPHQFQRLGKYIALASRIVVVAVYESRHTCE